MCSLDSGSPNFLMLFYQCATTFIGGCGDGKSWRRKKVPFPFKPLPPKHESKMKALSGKITCTFLPAQKAVQVKIGWSQALESYIQPVNHSWDHNVDPSAMLQWHWWQMISWTKQSFLWSVLRQKEFRRVLVLKPATESPGLIFENERGVEVENLAIYSELLKSQPVVLHFQMLIRTCTVNYESWWWLLLR